VLLEGGCFIVHRENIQLMEINVWFQSLSQHKHRQNEGEKIILTPILQTCQNWYNHLPNKTIVKFSPTTPHSSQEFSADERTVVSSSLARAVSRRPVTTKVTVSARVSPCWICSRQRGTGTGFSPCSSVFPC
jgi:hypothetical protein